MAGKLLPHFLNGKLASPLLSAALPITIAFFSLFAWFLNTWPDRPMWLKREPAGATPMRRQPSPSFSPLSRRAQFSPGIDDSILGAFNSKDFDFSMKKWKWISAGLQQKCCKWAGHVEVEGEGNRQEEEDRAEGRSTHSWSLQEGA